MRYASMPTAMLCLTLLACGCAGDAVNPAATLANALSGAPPASPAGTTRTTIEVPVVDASGRRVDRVQFTPQTDAGTSRVVYHDVDRLVYRDGERFAVVTASSGSQGRTIHTDCFAVQNAETQSGLRVRTAGARTLAVTVHDDGIEVASAEGAPDLAGASADGFRGDAMLALESARPRSAGTVVAAADPGDPTRQHAPQLAALQPGDGAAQSAREAGRQREARVLDLFGDYRRAFRPLRADPRESLLRLGFLYDNNSNGNFEFGIGGDLGLYRRTLYGDGNLTLSGRGQIVSRFQTNSESFDLWNTDYIGGLALGYARQANEYELYFYHVSSHLGDEKLDFGERERINFAKESLRFLYSRQAGPWRFYGGPTVTVSGDKPATRDRVMLQLGTEVDFSLWDVPLYAGLDLQGRQTKDFRPNVTTVLGVKLGDGQTGREPIRLYLEFFDGYSNMGQYFNERERYIMGGLGYDF